MEKFLFKCINILSFSEVAIDVDECDYQRATLHIRKSFCILILWNNLVSVCVSAFVRDREVLSTGI